MGHHVRELADFDRLETDNPEFLLALMDLRQLAGDRELFDRFDDVLQASSDHWHPQILDALIPLTDQRHAQFDDTLYQLEPDVKDGPGALRDIWATRTILKLAGEPRSAAAVSAPDDRLQEAEEFLMRVRSGIHLDMGRNLNVLSYELQEKAAERLQYAEPDGRRRAEALMTDYFRHARSVTRVLGRVRRAAKPAAADADQADRREPDLGGRRHHVRRQGARRRRYPVSWLRVFDAAVSRNVPGGRRGAGADGARAGSRAATRPTRSCRPVTHRQRFVQFLRPRPGLSARLAEMRDCGLLGAIFPEFDEISCRVTRDFYHKYTVDEHTLLTIRNVGAAAEQPAVRPGAARAARPGAAGARAAVPRRGQGAGRQSLGGGRRDGGRR